MKKKNSIIVMLLVAILFIYTLGISDIKEIKKNSDYSSIFVASYYAARYPDLKAAGITTDAALLNHFVTSGMKEGRQGSEEFNVYVYMNNYPDLKAAFGNDLPKYYLHYMNAGKAEGRLARGNATAPTTTAPTTTPVAPVTNTNGALHTAPTYPVLYANDISVLSYKAGSKISSWGGARTITQKELNNWNYNPYGLTSGTSALTGSASIGDIRYINYSLYEHYTMRQPHSIKMECYAVNKNGVPLFRRVGSSYNVYTQDKILVPAIDAITPTMNYVDVKNTLSNVQFTTSNCTTIANYAGALYGQLLIESYHLVSDTYNHEDCCIYVGNNCFYRFGTIENIKDMKLTKGTQPGTFKVYYSSQK